MKEVCISNLIREIGIRSKNIGDSRLLEYGLNSQQAKMISYIYANQEEGVIQKDLAKKFNRNKASITSMLQGLEKKGYIQRVVSKNNEREKNIYVLEKGKDLIEEFNELFITVENKLLNNFTDEEIKKLKDLLTRVNENLM
ncbi:MAG: MarR family winged helix-turn-helix transcriptional regulator [Sarcina sp.]